MQRQCVLHEIYYATIVTWCTKILASQDIGKFIWDEYSFRRSPIAIRITRFLKNYVDAWQPRRERRRFTYVESTWWLSTACHSAAAPARDVRKTPCGYSCKPRKVARKSARPRAPHVNGNARAISSFCQGWCFVRQACWSEKNYHRSMKLW